MNERAPNIIEVLSDQKRPKMYLLGFVGFTTLQLILTSIVPARFVWIVGTVILGLVVTLAFVVSKRDEKKLAIEKLRRKEELAAADARSVAEMTIEKEKHQVALDEIRKRVATPSVSVQSKPRRGLIVPVSKTNRKGDLYTSTSAFTASLYHCQPDDESGRCRVLKDLWLIHSSEPTSIDTETPQVDDGTLTSFAVARLLRMDFAKRGVRVHAVEIDSQNDAHGVFLRTMRVYREAEEEYGLKETEIVSDITGGTKPMTTGIALAGIPAARDLQYLEPIVKGRERTEGIEDIPHKPAKHEPMLVDIQFVSAAELLRQEAVLMRDSLAGGA